VLTINGGDAADVFLLRRASALLEGVSAPSTANTPAFVALLHGTLEDVRNQVRQDIERVNYDENVNGRLIVQGGAGDDYFASDDNSAITTLDGGAGNDTFQIGQVFGSPRISAPAGTSPASVAPGNEFFTVETTRGWLSRGATFPLTVYGGTGNDQITVYSNKAELRLEGNAGNDAFVIRAFALVSGLGVSTEGKTQAIAGEGEDDFFSQGTRQGFVTTIVGGLGNDTFSVAGDVTQTIISRDLEGRSALINHGVRSATDPLYDGLLAPGVALHVADAALGQIVITESGGTTTVIESAPSFTDTYQVALSTMPTAPVFITVSAGGAPSEEAAAGPKT